MLKSYFRSAVRTLLKNRVPSVINVVGLSIAVACGVTVYLFLRVYYTLDTEHANGDRIYMVEHVAQENGERVRWGTSPLALGPALATDAPQVEQAVRVAWGAADVRTATASFEERVGFADPGFFDVFTFPLAAGSPTALTTPGQAVLSEEAARKFFGTADAVGRRLTIALGEGGPQAVTVGAVAAPFPNNAGFRFDVLLPFDARPAAGEPADAWATDVAATFLLLRRPEDVAAVEAQMGRYLARWNDARPERPVEGFRFESLVRPDRDAYTVRARPTEAPHPAFVGMMVGMAAFMMLLSCVNYVNISLGAATRRLKEIGVRKVLGGTKKQLVVQFMAENLLLCALALVLGLALAAVFLVPLFNGLFVLDIGLSFTEDWGLGVFLLSLLAFVGVASGAYPAFYVASFQPALILQRKQGLGEKRWLTRGLLTLQFTIAFLAVMMTVLLLLNGRYLVGLAWGYAPDDVLTVRLSDPAQFAPLQEAALELAAVERTAGSTEHLGAGMGWASFSTGDDIEERETLTLTVGPGYAEAMGLRLRRGRFVDAASADDRAHAAVVTERFVEKQGWADGLGETLRIAGQDVTVVGVIEDVLVNPVEQPPGILIRGTEGGYRFLTVRTTPGGLEGTRAALAATWAERVPDLPFEAFAQREVFDSQFESYGNLARGLGYLAALALLIACMGVFGLASQNVARRMKEVSVRKVLGATVPHLVFLVNRAFVAILAIAALVATAVSVGAFQTLASFDAANLMPLTPLPFVAAYVLVFLTVAVSVASQSRTLALVPPAEALRSE